MVLCGLALWGVAGHARAQSPHDIEGPIEYVRNVPFDWVSGIGSEQLGKYLYLTGTRALSIYDVTEPENPALVSHVPYGYEFQNEDVSTNGETLLISESLPGSFLHVWDVSNPQLPLRRASVPLAGDHTSTCVMDCSFSYGSEGTLVDLREDVPQVVGNWLDLVGKSGVDTHDIEEVRPGLAVVSTIDTPFFVMDVSDPMQPKLVAEGDHPAPDEWLFHSARWPQEGRDPFLLLEAEAGTGPMMTWKVDGTPEKPTFSLVDSFTLGSTSHWFDEHPRFAGGGLVVVGWYSEGARLLDVDPKGKITELGHFIGNGGLSVPPLPSDTWAVYWIADNVFYSVDQMRGIDVLRYTGPLPSPSTVGARPQPPAPPGGGGAGSGDGGSGPSGGSGPGDGAAEVRTAARVAASRLRALKARGLRRARKLSVALQAPQAGTATVTVTARVRGRSVVVASGTRAYGAGGPGAVVARVDAAGRRALARSRGALKVRVTFRAAAGGATVSATR